MRRSTTGASQLAKSVTQCCFSSIRHDIVHAIQQGILNSDDLSVEHHHERRLYQPHVKKAQNELETSQKRISIIRKDVGILNDWWSSGATLKDLSQTYNMPEAILIHKCMVIGMQGLLLAEAGGINEWTMIEALAYNNQGYGLPTKATLNKAVEIEERAEYGRDLATYHELGVWLVKYRKT